MTFFFFQIVPESSATLGTPTERLVYMSTHHLGICKFSSNTEVRYIQLRDELQELYRNATRPSEEEVCGEEVCGEEEVHGEEASM